MGILKKQTDAAAAVEGSRINMKLFWKILIICVVLVVIFYAIVLFTAWA